MAEILKTQEQFSGKYVPVQKKAGPGAPPFSVDRRQPQADLAMISFHLAGPVVCTDSPLTSTATVTGMSLTSNS